MGNIIRHPEVELGLGFRFTPVSPGRVSNLCTWWLEHVGQIYVHGSQIYLGVKCMCTGVKYTYVLGFNRVRARFRIDQNPTSTF